MPWASAPLVAAMAVAPMVDPPSMPLERVVGQKVVTAFEGTAPSDALLRRLRSGRADIAVRAVRAGVDLLLHGGSEETSAGAYRRLLRAVRRHRLGEQRVRDSAERIIALRARASRAHVND